MLFERRSTEETDLHALREFKRTKPDTGAIMLAERVFERELRRLFEAGVDAVIDRRSSLQSLANYADLVLSGERAVQPFLLKPAETEPQSLISQEVSAPMQQLSRREQAVAGLLAIGLTDKEIARQLDLVHGTVRNYVRSVQQKLSLANRTQIAVWALQHGIVDSAASRRTVN